MPRLCSVLLYLLTCLWCDGYHTESTAEEVRLILSRQDLTWVSCGPGDAIDTVVQRLKLTHKVKMSSMAYAGMNAYVGGDPTAAMAWVLSVDYNDRGKVTGMKYGRFKASDSGIKIKTNRGIEAGSSISKVYELYGQSPSVKRRRDPAMRYVYLEYPFLLEETGQKGELIFTLQHKVKAPELDATVISIEWVLK